MYAVQYCHNGRVFHFTGSRFYISDSFGAERVLAIPALVPDTVKNMLLQRFRAHTNGYSAW